MLILIDKIILLLLCFSPVINMGFNEALIFGLLFTIIVSCFCQVIITENHNNSKIKRLIKSLLEILYCCVCFFSPEFALFLPLILYEAVRTRDIGAASICVIAVLWRLFSFGGNYYFVFLLCIAAAASCVKTLKIRNMMILAKKSRDDSAELERMLNRRNRQLRENLEYEVHITALNERNRIAREIHDNVGHLLSRSLLQTGALSAVCPKEMVNMKKSLDELKETLNSAMNSIRESVHGIRDEALDIKNEGIKILSPLSDKFQISFDCDITSEMPPKIKLCFISIMKEAVNNISRHSSGDRAEITVREHPSLYQLIIYDNGKTGKSKYGGEINEGMGLSDMRERAESIGGNFRIKTDNGFTVFAAVRKECL